MFCNHCKILGYTIQRCYKLHGYPQVHRLYRGKRVAASVIQDQESGCWLEDVHTTTPSETQPSVALSLPTLNTEQYQQLLQLRSKQSLDNNHPTYPATSVGTGFMAGKDSFCFATTFDSGN